MVWFSGLPPKFNLPRAASLESARMVICTQLTPEILLEKSNRPNLIIIHYTNQVDWSSIFTNKIHLTLVSENLKTTALTLDGAEYEVTPIDEAQLINKLLNAKYYKTEIVSTPDLLISQEEEEIIQTYPKYLKEGMIFGTFAIKRKHGFLTSTRGKKQGLKAVSFIEKVNHESLTVLASSKATLNAPLLDKVFSLNPEINYLLHGHELVGKIVHPEYEFAGTTGDLKLATKLVSGEKILLPHHGYLVGFKTFSGVQQFIQEKIWNNYRATFPVRYLDTTKFDEYLTKFLAHYNGRNLKVLDIGGGEQGTKALDLPNLEVYALDPYVKTLPTFNQGKIKWDSKEQFDLVVARGCINYFTPEELSKIPLFLKKGGIFLANTFLNAPPTTETIKEVTNQMGEKGQEIVQLKGNVVEHQLVFPRYQINHQFFYYSLADYQNHLVTFSYQSYGKNSVILKVMN